jgi:putative transposase
MVRAGVVKHPVEWVHGGYHEIQGLRPRSTILALDVLAEPVETRSQEELATAHREWIEEALRAEKLQWEAAWTKSLAVGSAEFIVKTWQMLGMRGRSRDVDPVVDSFMLREPQETYRGYFTPENRPIAAENGHFWSNYP